MDPFGYRIKPNDADMNTAPLDEEGHYIARRFRNGPKYAGNGRLEN